MRKFRIPLLSKMGAEGDKVLFSSADNDSFLLGLYNRSKMSGETVFVKGYEYNRLCGLQNCKSNGAAGVNYNIPKGRLVEMLYRAGLADIKESPNVVALAKEGTAWDLVLKLGLITVMIFFIWYFFPILANLSKPAVTEQEPEVRVNADQGSYLLREKPRCVPLPEFLYENYLYSSLYNPLAENNDFKKRFAAKCEEQLLDDPDNMQLKINLLGLRYQIGGDFLSEQYLVDHKVEATIQTAIDQGIEDAKLLMALMVRKGIVTNELNNIEWFISLLSSDNPKLLSVAGEMLRFHKLMYYKTISSNIANKYLSPVLARSVFRAKRFIAVPAGELVREEISNRIAFEAFDRAYRINKAFLAGHRLGMMSSGRGAPGDHRDYVKAFEYFSNIVERGSPVGNHFLGIYYLQMSNFSNGIDGFLKDDIRAIKYLEKDADNGNEMSKSVLAAIYLDRDGPYYNEELGGKYYCESPKGNFRKKTIYSNQPIKVNCETGKIEDE